MIGGVIFCGSIYLAQFPNNFYVFFVVYAVFVGMGYGLTYFLAVESAWSYFPEKKSLVSGIVLSCYSLGAVSAATYSAFIVNPSNESASIEI